MIRVSKSGQCRRRGVVLLETAIVMPVLILLLIGSIDLGMAAYSNNMIAAAAREGTRYAMVRGSLSSQPSGPTNDDVAVEQVVRNFAGLQASNLKVRSTWPDANNRAGSRITVDVTYSYTPTGLFGTKITMSSSSTVTITH